MSEQPQQTSNNKTIARNTVLLYARMILSILVSLYTSRVVLQVLGVDDYGVYGVVGGVVGMFSFLNAAMSGATSRFLTFEMGKSLSQRLKDIFSSALIIHIGIAASIFLMAETIGLWLLCNKLVIPDGRMLAAHVVFQCSIISMFFTITQVPYSAVIVAHEKMDVYAYVELLNVGLKLAVVYLLMIGTWDKLILYAILMLSVSMSITLIYRLYCIRHYEESRFHWIWDKHMLKPLLSFSGWNMMAELGYSFRVQGSNMALNMFFGTAINAAGGIASTVQGILLGLIANVVTAVRPQIIKNYSNGNLQRMNRLMTSSIRLNLLLVVLLTVPMFIDAPYVFHLWLGDVPQYCVEFCRLLLFAIFITSVSQIVTIGIHASGNIKQTSIVRNIIYLSTPFVIYVVLKFYPSDPVIGYVIIVISQMIACLTDIYILHRNIPEIESLSIFWDYLKSLVIAASVVYVAYLLIGDTEASFLRLIVDVVAGGAVLVLAFYTLMFKRYERDMISNAVKSIYKKVLQR